MIFGEISPITLKKKTPDGQSLGEIVSKQSVICFEKKMFIRRDRIVGTGGDLCQNLAGFPRVDRAQELRGQAEAGSVAV